MKKNVKIKVPFIIDDPIAGKIIYPLSSVLWIGYIFIIIFLVYIQCIDYFKGQFEVVKLVLFSTLVIFAGAIIFLLNGAISDFFYDYIVIDNKELKLIASKVFSNQEITFPLSQISKFVWLKKTVKENYRTVKISNDFSILDKNERRHILLADFNISMLEKSWLKFLKALEKQSGLAIEEVSENSNTIK